MSSLARPPTRYLVTDEPVTMADKFGTEMTFRVRIWRGEDATPVALASPIVNDDGLVYSPSCMTSKLANFIVGPMLGHPCCMMLYFEDQVFGDGSNVLEQVHFEYYGHSRRLKMFKPTRVTIEWTRLEHILGGKAER